MAMISASFPDGSLVSYDRARRELIITSVTNSVISLLHIPARPQPIVNAVTGAVTTTLATEPVRMTATVQKLGYKKHPIFKSAIWNQRILKVEPERISYHASESEPPKGVINLNVGCSVRVVQSSEPARKDRYEDNDNAGAVAMMSMSIGSHLTQTSGPIGKDNCVELHVPVRVENMLNGVLGSNPMALAFGGGVKQHVTNNRARTYYFSCDNDAAAQQLCKAIQANIDVLTQKPAATPNNNPAAGGSIFSGLDNAVNQMSNQKLMQSPATSLQWYKMMLGTKLSNEVVFPIINSFYDQLAAVNVRPHFQ